MVRTPGFHPGNRGSIPLRATKELEIHLCIAGSFSFKGDENGFAPTANPGPKPVDTGDGLQSKVDSPEFTRLWRGLPNFAKALLGEPKSWKYINVLPALFCIGIIILHFATVK